MIRKLLLILIALAATVTAGASNFTVTDTDGKEHDLFSYLNEGKYVLIQSTEKY